MERCTVCQEKIYRGMEEHVRMHQNAARQRQVNRHPERYPRLMERLRPRIVPVSVAASVESEPVGVGTEVAIPRPSAKPGIWANVLRFFGLGS